jgi:hypothetical protein
MPPISSIYQSTKYKMGFGHHFGILFRNFIAYKTLKVSTPRNADKLGLGHKSASSLCSSKQIRDPYSNPNASQAVGLLRVSARKVKFTIFQNGEFYFLRGRWDLVTVSIPHFVRHNRNRDPCSSPTVRQAVVEHPPLRCKNPKSQ